MYEPKSSKFHIVMFPWFALGHLTPFFHLSNKLADKGHQISFILPNKAKVSLESLNHHPNSLISFYTVSVPHVDGIPIGTETASDIPIKLTTFLATAMDLTRPQVEQIIVNLNPDFVFYDTAHWIPEITSKLQIKSVCYNVVCAAALAMAVVPARYRKDGLTEDDLAEPPTGYPSSTKVVLRRHEARNFLFISQEFGKGITFYERVKSAMSSCDAIAVRTCREIEGRFCDYLSSQFSRPVLLTGPTLPELTGLVLDDRLARWLSQFEKGKVIFCAFGSQFVCDKEEFQEILFGLEMTGFPFLVALKPPIGCSTIEEALPEGFKESVLDRTGMVHGGWVQQPLILNHPSVGCFVSHCGFGSMWEALKGDSQIVLVPQLGDQILNARIMAGEMKVAVEVERGNNGRRILRENLCKSIEAVMDEQSDVRHLVKENHAKWRDKLVSERTMSDYINHFITNLQGLLA